MMFSKHSILCIACLFSFVYAADDRLSATRLRHPNTETLQSSSMTSTLLPSYDRFFKALASGPVTFLNMLTEEKAEGDAELNQEKDAYDAMMEVFESLAANLDTSMSLSTIHPSMAPQSTPVLTPAPVDVTSSPTVPAATKEPTVPKDVTTKAPSDPKATKAPKGTKAPKETLAPVLAPTEAPVVAPVAPTPPDLPAVITNAPVVAPTLSPLTATPTVVLTTEAPQTQSPTLSNCPGITQEQRIEQILAILDAAANATEIRNGALAQGKATAWLLNEDSFQICPDNDKLLQRWTMAVIYYSTGGDAWFQCSAAGSDNCGNENPFVNQERFLSGSNECEWAGISCVNGCVTEIEFGTYHMLGSGGTNLTHLLFAEENNLVGTIATEIGLLTDLLVWGMERGRLSSTIPTEIGQLTNLIFIDLDYNQLTGTLTSELLTLGSLTQLDLNNNRLSGNILGITEFPRMEFLQLHDNLFTGSIPSEIGLYTSLSAFTLHESMLSGDMPQEVCDLLLTAGKGGVLTSLIADCTQPNANINCSCCTDCRVAQ